MPQINALVNRTPLYFAGQPECPSIDKLREQFGCSHEHAAELLDLIEAGYHYGKLGYWPDGEFAADADWVYGLGEAIMKIECVLDVEDDEVFKLFEMGHGAGLEWYEKNVN